MGAFFSPPQTKKFFSVALKTQAETTKLTTPTVEFSPIFYTKFDSSSAWGAARFACGVHLQLSPVNLAHIFSPARGVGARLCGKLTKWVYTCLQIDAYYCVAACW